MPEILYFPDYRPQAQRLANSLGYPCHEITLHRFPDGESLIQLPLHVAQHLIIYRSLDKPNDKLIELLLTARTARNQGVRRLSLVAPYLCYMRQDIAFHPGEAISQQIIGEFLATLFDDVITVDPHLHRITTLDEALPATNALTLSATGVLGEFLRQQVRDPLLLGPDAESRQWVEAIARQGSFEFCVAEKMRQGDRQVSIHLPERAYAGRKLILVDDIVSTGHTLAEAARQLSKAGASEIHCLVTHALFTEDADETLRAAGVNTIWSSDSVSHPTNTVHLDTLLAETIRAILD